MDSTQDAINSSQWSDLSFEMILDEFEAAHPRASTPPPRASTPIDSFNLAEWAGWAGIDWFPAPRASSPSPNQEQSDAPPILVEQLDLDISGT